MEGLELCIILDDGHPWATASGEGTIDGVDITKYLGLELYNLGFQGVLDGDFREHHIWESLDEILRRGDGG